MPVYEAIKEFQDHRGSGHEVRSIFESQIWSYFDGNLGLVMTIVRILEPVTILGLANRSEPRPLQTLLPCQAAMKFIYQFNMGRAGVLIIDKCFALRILKRMGQWKVLACSWTLPTTQPSRGSSLPDLHSLQPSSWLISARSICW